MRVRRADGVLGEPVDDRIVLFDPTAMELITLNAVGSLLWTTLDEPQDLSALAQVVRARHTEVTAEQAESDVAAFVAALQQKGLLVDAEG